MFFLFLWNISFSKQLLHWFALGIESYGQQEVKEVSMVSVGVFLPRRSSALPEWHKNWLFRMRPMISASLIRSHTMPDVVGVSVEYWGVSMHAFFRIEACFFFHATALVGEVRHYSTVRIQ